MQLLQELKILPVTAKQYNMTGISIKEASSDFEVKEKRSSDVSLRTMNPVASGDNVTNLISTHKIKDESASLVPCCEGRELQISEELVRSGLSAISVKHDSVVQCLSMSRACERRQVPLGLVKHRNSFRSLHRPDLKQVPYLRRMTPDEIETLFRGYAELPRIAKKENKETTDMAMPPDENLKTRDPKDKEAFGQDDGSGITALHPIPETRSGAEDVPAGMRLHGARARLYTSVLAGAKAGDQSDAVSTNEHYETHVADIVPEDEVQLTEELQIILPPRCDDITAESSIASNSNDGTR